MQKALYSLLLIAATTASVVRRTGNTPDHYTICGADRGWTEKDSLQASKDLAETIVTSDAFFMAKYDCIYAHVNTTIVSLCNGNYGDRRINRDEVRRGTEQLVKDCGLEGGFTGIHVVNNLTFAAYGVGGVALSTPGGSNPPDTPGSKRLSRREVQCPGAYDGVPSYNCDTVNKLKEDGSCGGEISPTKSNCQTYCEIQRTKFLGPEQKAPGRGGDAQLPGKSVPEVSEGTEISVSNGFSISAEGIVRDAIGAGVSYQWSITTTTTKTVSQTNNDVSYEFYARWVVFPKLVESCGSVSRRRFNPSLPCSSPNCVPTKATCEGDVETIPHVCSMVPVLNDAGQPEVYFAIRYENKDGTPAPFEKQHTTYKSVCPDKDPDHDGEQECYTNMPSLMRNFKLEDAYNSLLN